MLAQTEFFKLAANLLASVDMITRFIHEAKHVPLQATLDEWSDRYFAWEREAKKEFTGILYKGQRIEGQKLYFMAPPQLKLFDGKGFESQTLYQDLLNQYQAQQAQYRQQYMQQQAAFRGFTPQMYQETLEWDAIFNKLKPDRAFIHDMITNLAKTWTAELKTLTTTAEREAFMVKKYEAWKREKGLS